MCFYTTCYNRQGDGHPSDAWKNMWIFLGNFQKIIENSDFQTLLLFSRQNGIDADIHKWQLVRKSKIPLNFKQSVHWIFVWFDFLDFNFFVCFVVFQKNVLHFNYPIIYFPENFQSVVTPHSILDSLDCFPPNLGTKSWKI